MIIFIYDQIWNVPPHPCARTSNCEQHCNDQSRPLHGETDGDNVNDDDDDDEDDDDGDDDDDDNGDDVNDNDCHRKPKIKSYF